MNWITVSWPMAIAACVVLALIHYQIALRMAGKARLSHFHFACGALAVGAVGVCELLLLHARDLESYRQFMFWAQLPITAMLLSFTGFSINYFDRPRKSLALVTVVCIAICLIGNILLPPEMRLRYPESIRVVETLGGVVITLAPLHDGWLSGIEILAVGSLLLLVAEASIRSWRQEGRKNAAMVGAGLVFFLLATRGYALLVEHEVVNSPFFFIFPILVLLAAMGRQLSMDVFRAAQLADDLRENERRMDMVNRAIQLGLWQWEAPAGGIWMTRISRNLLGIDDEGPIDMKRFAERVHCDDRQDFQRAVHAAVDSCGEFMVDCRVAPEFVSKDRWLHVRGSIDAGLEPSTRTMRGIVADITDRKQAQLKVDELRGDLAHMTRVSTMGELAASIAHELNQPLAAILSNAQAARRMLATPGVELDEIREILDDIIKADKRAADVIRHLRALIQRKERGTAERINLNDIVHDAERLTRSERIARDVELELSLQEGLPDILAGRVELQQALLNLMVNAMDAMENLASGKRRLVISTRANGRVIMLSVCDSGPGVPEELRESIFQPFYTTKQQGLGMGLAICRSMIEAHEGRLFCEDLPDGGAAFRIEFPAMEP